MKFNKNKLIAGILLSITNLSVMTAPITSVHADEVTNYQTQLDTKNKELETLRKTKTEKETALNSKKTEVATLETEIANLESNIDSKQEIGSEAQKKLQEATKTATEAENKLNERKEFLEKKGFVGKVTESKDLTDFSKNLSEAVQGEDSKTAEYEKSVKEAKSSLEQVEKEVSTEVVALNKLVTQKTEKTTALVTKKTELSNLENETKKATEEVTKKEGEVTETLKKLNESKDVTTTTSTSTATGTAVVGVNGSITITAEQLAAANASTSTYPWGQCTWGVKALASWVGPYWGNAAQWDDSARSEGFRVDNIPEVGSIVVWDDGGYGHVAYVIAVEGQNIQILEANYGANGQGSPIKNYRGGFINPYAQGMGAVYFIHNK